MERVDGGWVDAVAAVPDELLGALAGRWIELLEEELGLLPREEKPWIRDLAARIVTFCRGLDGARDVVFAWALLTAEPPVMPARFGPARGHPRRDRIRR